MDSVGTTWLWLIFAALVLSVLITDMFFLGGRKTHKVCFQEACLWTFIWIAAALIFNLILWFYLKTTTGIEVAQQKSLEFFTGYLVEESLSFDNMFVILMIFNFFAVPAEYQRRVLLYGVFGAVVMRFIMIFAGIWLINQFHWVLYLFGIFLVYTGIKMLFIDESVQDLTNNSFLIWLRKNLRITERFHQEHFFSRQNKLLYVTPLFIVLILVELSDLIFAFDSIPAIFAITRDPFIVFTSNIFAILGLRSIYFLLANIASRFHLLKYGIALVLIFIGAKILIEHWYVVPVLYALAVVGAILITSIILSWVSKSR